MDEAITVTSDALWRLPPDLLALEHDEVHVWRAPLRSHASCLQFFETILSPDERRKAAGFRFSRDRDNYIIARGLLRSILSRYLNADASRLRFRYNAHGKPFLAQGHGDDALCFNLSHSHGLALYAVARDRLVGIDIEHVRTEFSFLQIAKQFFSLREYTALSSLPTNLQPQAFFDCWTRKEAYVKATGEGLSFDPKKLDVTLLPGEPAALLSVSDRPDEASRWSISNLNVGEGYVAAVTVERHGWQLKYWQCPDISSLLRKQHHTNSDAH